MEIGTVHSLDIVEEMRNAYLDYAMSVIVARALPDARDGLKPVHRRILYAMYDMGLRPDSPYKKSARIVGEVLGKYHPHGDIAVYEAMARMAQDFSMRYPLVDGQGNFGSIDGDSPAAMRYTEARLNRIAMELLLDIEKGTVEWLDNFDGTLQEPSVLPARFPNLLVNGSSGIAVGMATNIPPHNLSEVCDALCFLIDRWDELDDVSVEDLLGFVEGPDFPTGGTIVGQEGILQAYATGHGRIVVRAMAHMEELAGNRHRIVVTELPYQTNKSALLERIAELVREGRLPDISDLRDESDKRGMSIVIELKRGASPQDTLAGLFKHTAMQSTFSVQMLALVNGEPRLLSLKRALQLYIEHRLQVLTRRSQYELTRARERAHILEGLKTALDHLDAVVQTIRESPDAETARGRLTERFALTEVQAQAILDMQLRRLAALERQKIEDEYLELIQRIAYLEDLLASPRKVLYLIKVETQELRKAYGDGRRTRIIRAEAEAEAGAAQVATEEPVPIALTHRGYVRRLAAGHARAEAGAERLVRALPAGAADATLGEDRDEVLTRLDVCALDTLLFVSSRGKAYQERVYQIPSPDRAPAGVPLASVLALDADEHTVAVLPVASFDGPGQLVMVTRLGRVKRLPLAECGALRPGGVSVISLEGRDELVWARLEGDGADLLIVTAQGQALRFPAESVRPTGRAAGGVNAIKLEPGDRVIGACVAAAGSDLLLATAKGFGKRVAVDEFTPKGRAGKGVRCFGGSAKTTGPLVAARVVGPADTALFISKAGVLWRIPVSLIPRASRDARGAKLVELGSGDDLVRVEVNPRVE